MPVLALLLVAVVGDTGSVHAVPEMRPAEAPKTLARCDGPGLSLVPGNAHDDSSTHRLVITQPLCCQCVCHRDGSDQLAGSGWTISCASGTSSETVRSTEIDYRKMCETDLKNYVSTLGSIFDPIGLAYGDLRLEIAAATTWLECVTLAFIVIAMFLALSIVFGLAVVLVVVLCKKLCVQ